MSLKSILCKNYSGGIRASTLLNFYYNLNSDDKKELTKHSLNKGKNTIDIINKLKNIVEYNKEPIIKYVILPPSKKLSSAEHNINFLAYSNGVLTARNPYYNNFEINDAVYNGYDMNNIKVLHLETGIVGIARKTHGDYNRLTIKINDDFTCKDNDLSGNFLYMCGQNHIAIPYEIDIDLSIQIDKDDYRNYPITKNTRFICYSAGYYERWYTSAPGSWKTITIIDRKLFNYLIVRCINEEISRRRTNDSYMKHLRLLQRAFDICYRKNGSSSNNSNYELISNIKTDIITEYEDNYGRNISGENYFLLTLANDEKSLFGLGLN